MIRWSDKVSSVCSVQFDGMDTFTVVGHRFAYNLYQQQVRPRSSCVLLMDTEICMLMAEILSTGSCLCNNVGCLYHPAQISR
jgi:hypothetical protein